MHFKLPKIYPLTDVSITKLSHLEQVERLIAGGASVIQLRDKRAAPKDFYESAKACVEFAKSKNVKIIINDRVDIALAAKADGVHLGQNDLPPENARKILGDKAIIGFSTHSILQAAEAARLPIDYIAVGPIFATFSKENADAIVGLENLKKVREKIGDFPLVAIGGINFENAESVLQSGADSLAIIGAILNPTDKISENVKGFLKTIG
ncbi:MAG: thiamine phosphate synthase [Pyrinomonadaceae bacterium]